MTQGTKILLIDDDALLLTLLERKLTARGYAVTTANDGSAGLGGKELGCTDVVRCGPQLRPQLGPGGEDLLGLGGEPGRRGGNLGRRASGELRARRGARCPRRVGAGRRGAGRRDVEDDLVPLFHLVRGAQRLAIHRRCVSPYLSRTS